MKKLFAICILGGLCAAGCVNEEMPVSSTPVQEISVTGEFAQSKISFGTLTGGNYPVSWSQAGEGLRLYERVDDASWSAKNFSVAYYPSKDLKTAEFKFNIEPKNASKFDYYAIYPSTGSTYQISAVDSKDGYLNTIRMGTFGIQTPKADWPDSKFSFMIGKKEGLEKQPSSLDLTFEHVMAYVRMTVSNLPLPPGDTVSAIRFSPDGKTCATGFVDYIISRDSTTLTRGSKSANYIEINPKNIAVNNSSFDVWFTLTPMTIAANETFTVSFVCPSGNLSKTVTIKTGKDMVFRKGQCTSFTIDMSEASIPKTLSFDFSSNEMTQFPTSAQSITRAIRNTDLNSSKVYKFYSAGGCYHGADKDFFMIYEKVGVNTGYFGLPAIQGYKLTRITATRGTQTGADVRMVILSDIQTQEVAVDTLEWPKGVSNPSSIVIPGSKEGTRYYIKSVLRKGGGESFIPIKTLTLEYTVASAKDAHPADEYDIYLLIGQSNMAGRGDIAVGGNYTSYKPVAGSTTYLLAADDAPIFATQPYNSHSTIRKNFNQQGYNLGKTFAETVNAENDRKVLLVVNARGGTSISQWQIDAEELYFNKDDGDETYLYSTRIPNFVEEAARRTKAAMKYGTLKGILWHQGEGDCSPAKVQAYPAKLKKMVSDLRSAIGDTSAEVPFIAGEINHTLDSLKLFNPMLQSLIDSIPNFKCVSAEDLTLKSDNVHFDRAGIEELGKRYANTLLGK